MLLGFADLWARCFGGLEAQPNLELFRIVFGLTSALYYAKRLKSASLCLGPGSISSNLWRMRGAKWRLSIFALLPRSTWLPKLVIGAGLMGSMGVALGWHTSTCAALLLTTQLMLSAELSFVATGTDFVVTIMSGLLMLSPAGTAWSLDASWGPHSGVLPATPVWATRLMQIQVCLIYVFGVAQKLSEAQWRSGWAVYYALHAEVVARPWAAWMARGSKLPRMLSWSTIAIQLLAPIALWWPPTRLPTVVALAILHVGLDLCLRLWPFQWLMISCLLLFVDLPTWSST